MKNELKGHTPAASGPPPPPTYDAPLPPGLRAGSQLQDAAIVRHAGETQVITTAGPPPPPPRKNIEENYFFLRGLPYENTRFYHKKWWVIRICALLSFCFLKEREVRQMEAEAQAWKNRAATPEFWSWYYGSRQVKATVRIAPPPERAFARFMTKEEKENGWHDYWHPAMSSMTEAQIAEFLNKAGLVPQSRTHRIAPRQNPDAGTNRVLAAWG